MLIMEESTQFLNALAGDLAEQGHHKEAIACLKKGLKNEPENGELWFNLALSYRALRRNIDSVNALIEAAHFLPYDADVWDTLGIVLFEIGSYKEARIAYKRALKIDSAVGRIWNNYGTLLFNEEKYNEARQAFESAIALDDKLTDAIFNLRDTHTELGNFEQAKVCDTLLKDLGYEFN